MCFCVMGDSTGTCECTLTFSSTHIRAHTHTHACTIGRANSFPDVGAAGSTGNHRNRTKEASVACSSNERLTHFRPHAAGSHLLHAASHASPSDVHPSPADDHGLPSHFLHASFGSHWRQMRALFMPVRLRVLHRDAFVFYFILLFLSTHFFSFALSSEERANSYDNQHSTDPRSLAPSLTRVKLGAFQAPGSAAPAH
jgi:hypothetical protein